MDTPTDAELIGKAIYILLKWINNHEILQEEGISYKELYTQMGLNPEDFGENRKGNQILGMVNDVSLALDNILLTSIVISTGGSKEPGSGYYTYATSKGLFKKGGDEAVFLSQELKKLQAKLK